MRLEEGHLGVNEAKYYGPRHSGQLLIFHWELLEKQLNIQSSG